MAFKKGHLKYTTKGDFKKGYIPWNANTAIWVGVKCLQCGKEFKVRKQKFERGRGKYCSKNCYNLSLKGKIPWNKSIKITKLCLQCNKKFEVRLCEENRKFCSKKCANNFRKGKKRKPFAEEHKKKISESNKKSMSNTIFQHGKKHPNWKGGITSFYMVIRNLDEYKEWRMKCLKRDWFRCQDCVSKVKLEVHHLKTFTELVNEFLKKYNQFSIIEDKETLTRLAFTYKPFWDINNGKTLCEECHKSLKRGVK
jgi:endogenous inhibitor of DNA gyrase (YacG/DUF329 family)